MANGTPTPSKIGATDSAPAPDATGAATDAPAPAATPGPLPEVRQCQDPADRFYGCSAIASGIPFFKWGVFNPLTGAHWEEDDRNVQSWKVLS